MQKPAAINNPKLKAWHHTSSTEVMELLEVDGASGLSTEEVARRQKQFGFNRVAARRGIPAWVRFMQQFNQALVYILLLAALVTASLGEWVDSVVIASVLILNAIVGFLQEAKAEKSIEALAGMVITETTVRRDGRIKRIPSEELVPGDVVLLQAGDRVPADLRLYYARSLQVDESALTGESVPVHKQIEPLALDTILADRKNLSFAGTLVTTGQGEGVVWATGDKTETGQIAGLIGAAVDLQTPLTRKISEFSSLLLWIILGLALLTFAFGVVRGEKPFQMFMAAVALAVGSIPEGLPAAVTIVLAVGVGRMAKRNVVIRRLPAVETLGSTTVICSDKTGTLTENQMTVREIFAGGKLYSVTGSGYEAKGEIQVKGHLADLTERPALREILVAGVLCNESSLQREAGRAKIHGDPTEAALIVAAEKGGILHADTQRDTPRLDMIPFESEHMFRATLHNRPEGRVIYKVGAVERLLERCVDELDDSGKLAPLDKEAVHTLVEQMASRGLRVLAFARRHVAGHHEKLEHSHVSAGLTFLGLQGMLDPPRFGVIEAVRQCQVAGVAVKMITGDHLITARAIAEQIGLIGGDGARKFLALSGRELEKISDEELPQVAERTAVFARVAPEQKLRLVRALQARGHILAMTGDGVNDAPALKQADIGVAMGISGTDVAKYAAAMVLLDDNFASIVSAVKEGRGVFDNLTKFIVWIMPTNLGEALLLICSMLVGLPLPALPLQLLWINLTDTLLGLPLAFEPKEANVMLRPPRDSKSPLLTHALIMRTGLVSLIMLVGGLGLFYWEIKVEESGLAVARTVVVNVVVLIEAAYLFNCRSLGRSLLSIGLFSNRWAILGAMSMVAAQLVFTCVPFMNALFHSSPLGAGAWLRIIALAAFTFLAVELEKWIRYGRETGKSRVAD